MTTDRGDSIKAFAQARINQLMPLVEKGDAAMKGRAEGGIEELEAVVRLCDGLQQQNDLLKTAMGIPTFK